MSGFDRLVVVVGGVLFVFCLAVFSEDKGGDGVSGYLTPENLAKLEKGKIVTFFERVKDENGKTKGRGVTLGLIGRPLDDVWKVLLDYKAHSEYLPRVIKTEIYQEEKDGETGICETLKVLWKEVEYHVLQRRDDAAHTLTWRLDTSRKNDIADTFGQWRLLAHGEGKCIAAYVLHVDTGMAVPQFVEDFLTRGDLPDVVEAVRKRAESGGQYKK